MKTNKLLIILAIFPALLCFDPARADVVEDWIDIAASQEQPTGSPTREDAERTWSIADESNEIVAVSMFQAVNTIEQHYTPYRETLRRPDGAASATAAAVAAAHAALVRLFPSNRERLDEAYALSLEGMPENEALQQGIAVGEHAAAQVIDWRIKEKPTAAVPYRPLASAGRWIPTTSPVIPPFAAVMTPWLLVSPHQFRPAPPPDLKSAVWARDFNETRLQGSASSKTRTAKQTREALFWDLQRWDRTIRQVADRPGRTLLQNARLYALVAMISADAGFAISDAKMTFVFWRPITAIRNADQDGNDSTERQADWLPLLPTPIHPEYPCAHCVYGMSLAVVLEAEGPPSAQGVPVTSTAYPNVVLRVPSYMDLAKRISESRILAG
ncbi:MAG TPA: vanadium-dependent haloperoxidase, partial [Steroidobacteraceae bacterium]